MSLPLTHAHVDDLHLALRFNEVETRQIRRHLEQHAEPASVRCFFSYPDLVRTAAQLFDKAVDGGVSVESVAKAIERAQKTVIAKELRTHVFWGIQKSAPLPTNDDGDDGDENVCVVCMESLREATMQCGHANLCMECGNKLDACPTCRVPKKTLIKLYT